MDALTREPAEIQTRRRSRSWIMLLLCALVTGATVYTIWFWPVAANNTATRARNANTPIPVLQAIAVAKTVPVYLDGLGTVQASATVTIKPMVDGPLVAVNFTEGAAVRKNDVLAQIDPRFHQAALDNALAKKAQNEALLANARLDSARYQKLVASNFTSAQQADTSRAQVAQLEALVRQDQAAIDTARTNLSYTTIQAPIDGRAGIRQIDMGNIVRASDPAGLVTLTALQPVSVLFTLPQQSLPAVARAMLLGTPIVLAMAQGNAQLTGAARLLDTGTLTVLDNTVDPATGTIKLKASFPNAESRLWPGGFVSVRLEVESIAGAIVIPPAAVQRGPRGSFVFVIDDANTVSRRPITLGFEDQQASIVSDGVKAGERVVVDGASRLSDGSKVAITQPPAGSQQPAMPAPNAPGTRRRPPADG